MSSIRSASAGRRRHGAPRRAGTDPLPRGVRRRKGVYDLLDAIGQVRNEGHDVRLRIVGPPEFPDETSGLRGRASRGLTETVTLIGPVPSDDVSREFREADIFCLPSYREGLPMAILEAMAAGLPVVATAVGGSRMSYGTTNPVSSPAGDARGWPLRRWLAVIRNCGAGLAREPNRRRGARGRPRCRRSVARALRVGRDVCCGGALVAIRRQASFAVHDKPEDVRVHQPQLPNRIADMAALAWGRTTRSAPTPS